ncbi:hypothetical protein [Chryseosolibacter indicus]|uniref:Uncharacterized protein n=1 Tax=Chryseosolibacter indicus TaxID=2782351 RepID=A0ABS5VY81_9BACT|nr:hypothetical protein [Chryseosolibacter indicus]MBT1706367.1 hypothetical protein [Chryseosolibacter indicus]
MLLESKIFKGIEYIHLSDLPEAQKERFLQTTSRYVFIKILIDGKVVSNCIEYSTYSNWFHTIYKAEPKKQASDNKKAVEIEPQLVLKAS